jgi:protein involved in polysaccharide export with SLBB domain
VRIRVAAAVAAMGVTACLSGCAAPSTTTLAGVPVPTLKTSAIPGLRRFEKADPALAMYPDGSSRGESTFDDVPYATWDPQYEPAYRFYVGDEVEMTVPGAPELNKTLSVGPDGRAAFPYVGEVMLANRPLEEVRQELRGRYGAELRNPNVQLAVKAAPVKIFVGGEVGQPAEYVMTGDGDALRAIIQAGGFRSGADLKHVIIIRRAKGGGAMMKTTDLSEALRHGWQPDLVPLRRDDIVYVPRSGIAKVGLFMQQYFRDALPLQFTYALNGVYSQSSTGTVAN